jgi:menaquinone-dependent protoporphyrinogen IX oxidase
MSNTIVIYKSKYGSAKQYAKWLAEELDADIAECSPQAFANIEKYDTVIYGGSLYAVGILGFALFKENFYKITADKIVVFTVGASPAWEEAVAEVRENNFPQEMRDKIMHVHLRGGFDYKGLNFIDKILMALLKLKIKCKPESKRTPDERGMLGSYSGSHDWKSKSALHPILDYVQKA